MRRTWAIGALLTAVAVLMSIAVPRALPAAAAVELLTNPGLEQLDPGGFPTCWRVGGYGTNTFTAGTTAESHTGATALRLTMTARTTGDRKIIMKETAACAPAVVPDHQYDLSAWYQTSTANTVITVFRQEASTGTWKYWTDLATLPVTAAWARAEVRTPPIPADTARITWGVTVYGVGTLTVDDFSTVDVTVPDPEPACEPGQPCERGVWQVMPFETPVRGIHAVVLHNGRVLLVAGSGNDEDAFDAGSFTSAVYDPVAGSFQNVVTPADLFCAGHVQLPDGRVLIMGGTADYANAEHGYKGLKDSYVFDPATNAYTRTNDMNSGHWYPSATVMGNGDVISLGGLGADSSGTVTTERFSYAQQRWLPLAQVRQTYSFFGLYPSMILLQDGRLFYTGSHVFGNGRPGTGASVYDYDARTITDVPGLQARDQRDQSMSVLLPPAQEQRVLTVGGGNIITNPDANRYTDLIDLTAPDPAYTPGPLLPTGRLTGGVPQTAAQGKMYVSLVLLPDGTVFETGGAMHNRADPVFEASIFDPETDTWRAGMATDPVARNYHSSAFLLPDGRVMAVGSNPGDGSFDNRISIYSPPYIFAGDRPEILGVPDTTWSYGQSFDVFTDSPVVSASLIKPAAVTHSSDPNQRYVDLPLTVQADRISLNVTANPNLAPPGWYMLFVTNAAGVPSVAQWVQLG